MKKTFSRGETVRLKNTLCYGVIECIFSDTEYWCTFDNHTQKYNVNMLSYGIFKQLVEWVKRIDNKTTEEMENSIVYLNENRSWIAVVKKIIGGIGLFCFFWLCVWVFTLIKN